MRRHLLHLLFGAVTVFAQSDFSAARESLEQFRTACNAEHGSLWGIPIWGRLLLVDRASRAVLATDQVPDGHESSGLYSGILPSDILFANTSITWGDREWAMIPLPLPQDPFLRIRLLAHESFHRMQKELKLAANDSFNSHLDTETGRLWLRLELRVLARALREEDKSSRTAVNDALLFRATRQKLHPSAETSESSLEIQEGLAEYTGTVVAMRFTGESVARIARLTESAEDQTAFARSFAYATGPALGLLLDRYSPGWRKNIRSDSNLAAMLANAVAFRAPADPERIAKQRADAYAYKSVALAEHERATAHEKLLTEFRSRFIDGPILQFPKEEGLYRSFNPNNLVSFGEHGTVYPTGTFTAPWGKLQVDSVGALLAPDNQSLRVAAPDNPAARPLKGPGWTLELAPGWTIRQAARERDFEIVREH